MSHETDDMIRATKSHHEVLAQRAVRALRRNNFGAEYASDREQALSMVVDMIPEGASIGMGDSLTLQEAGITPYLEGCNKYQVLNPFARDAEGCLRITTLREQQELLRKTLLTDVFLSGTNAITLDGKLVNTDGRGNRVAAMIFGPRKVILVAGANKIVRDEAQARQRIQEVCAPIHGRRLRSKQHSAYMDLRTARPCVKTGVCGDCKTEARSCCYTGIIEFQRGWAHAEDEESKAYAKTLPWPRINVVIIGESLGI